MGFTDQGTRPLTKYVYELMSPVARTVAAVNHPGLFTAASSIASGASLTSGWFDIEGAHGVEIKLINNGGGATAVVSAVSVDFSFVDADGNYTDGATIGGAVINVASGAKSAIVGAAVECAGILAATDLRNGVSGTIIPYQTDIAATLMEEGMFQTFRAARARIKLTANTATLKANLFATVWKPNAKIVLGVPNGQPA